MASTVRYTSFPKTQPPPPFIAKVVTVFDRHEPRIGTIGLIKGLTSNEVLAVIRDELKGLGFEVEAGKKKAEKIQRPVFYGENGKPTLNYQIDAYHTAWRCGLEVEAGRGWMGNAVYRDLIQALVMVEVDHLVLAVAHSYKYNWKDTKQASSDYAQTVAVADALYGHTRMKLPYGLTVIGY